MTFYSLIRITTPALSLDRIMYNKISQLTIARADVVIKPKVNFVGSADFSQRNEAILEGERAAMAAMPRSNEVLGRYYPNFHKRRQQQ